MFDSVLALPVLEVSDNPLQAGLLLSAIGWGKTRTSEIAETLQITTNPYYINPEVCDDFWGDIIRRESTICAGLGQEDTCKGAPNYPIKFFKLPYRWLWRPNLCSSCPQWRTQRRGSIILLDCWHHFLWAEILWRKAARSVHKHWSFRRLDPEDDKWRSAPNRSKIFSFDKRYFKQFIFHTCATAAMQIVFLFSVGFCWSHPRIMIRSGFLASKPFFAFSGCHCFHYEKQFHNRTGRRFHQSRGGV